MSSLCFLFLYDLQAVCSISSCRDVLSLLEVFVSDTALICDLEPQNHEPESTLPMYEMIAVTLSVHGQSGLYGSLIVHEIITHVFVP